MKLLDEHIDNTLALSTAPSRFWDAMRTKMRSGWIDARFFEMVTSSSFRRQQLTADILTWMQQVCVV